MTGREFNEVGGVPAGFGLSSPDWDRLADYVGGALDGPESDDVAARIAEDPAWNRAYAALSGATDDVEADLAAFGRSVTPIPDDVAARIDAALAAAGPATAGADAAVGPGRPPRLSERPGRGGPPVVPAGRSDPARPAAARRARRWRRWAAPILAATAVLAFGGLVVNVLTRSQGEVASTADREAGPASAPQAGAGSAPGADQLFGASSPRLAASGTDYRRGTVGSVARRMTQVAEPSITGDRGAKSRPSEGPVPAPEVLDAAVDPSLRRLTGTVPLLDCMSAVAREHGRTAASVDLVDFARFEGSPAVVIIFTDTAAEKWVWVAGPACGTAGVGADTRHSAKVE